MRYLVKDPFQYIPNPLPLRGNEMQLDSQKNKHKLRSKGTCLPLQSWCGQARERLQCTEENNLVQMCSTLERYRIVGSKLVQKERKRGRVQQ